MPSHPDRVRRNYCEHEFKDTYGVDIAENIVAAKICTKCHLIVRLGIPGVDEIRPSWYENTADLMHIKQDINDTFRFR